MTFARKPYKPARVYPSAIPESQRRSAVFARMDVPAAPPLAKAAPERSETYRRLVAALPCIHCGIHGHSQAAHADQGKGAHIKSDDRTCYPACAPRMGLIGCHALIGMTGSMPREARRALEQEYAERTRDLIVAAGLWPKNLERWEK